MALSSMDYLRLADELSVIDAAILITGNDPSERKTKGDGFDDPFREEQRTDYDGFDAVFKSIKNAVLSNKIAAVAVYPVQDRDNARNRSLTIALRKGNKLFQHKGLNFYDHDALVFLQGEPDWAKTTIEVSNLKAWLRTRGVYPDFFFPSGDPESFLNPKHDRYSAKLACAVNAWKTVTAPAANKSVKKTLEDWVADNGKKYDLANKQGVVPKNAIEDIAKVANWQPNGGATITGGEVTITSPRLAQAAVQNFEVFEVHASPDGTRIEIERFWPKAATEKNVVKS